MTNFLLIVGVLIVAGLVGIVISLLDPFWHVRNDPNYYLRNEDEDDEF